MGLETGNGDPHVQCTYKIVEYSFRGYITLLFLWGVHFVPMSTLHRVLPHSLIRDSTSESFSLY